MSVINGTVYLHPSSQSDIDEIENLIFESVQSAKLAGNSTVLPARPPRASIPVSTSPSPFMSSSIPPTSKKPNIAAVPIILVSTNLPSSNSRQDIANSGFGSSSNTLIEPVWDTVKRDLSRILSNLKLVVYPNPNREVPGKALRDWDLWGPFFFIIFLGLALSWSASVRKVV